MILKFKGTLVRVHVDKKNFPHRITLIDATDGMPYAIATVAIPEIKDLTGYVAIKSYSENEGMLEFLIDNKIVEKPTAYFRSGFVQIPICKLV